MEVGGARPATGRPPHGRTVPPRRAPRAAVAAPPVADRPRRDVGVAGAPAPRRPVRRPLDAMNALLAVTQGPTLALDHRPLVAAGSDLPCGTRATVNTPLRLGRPVTTETRPATETARPFGGDEPTGLPQVTFHSGAGPCPAAQAGSTAETVGVAKAGANVVRSADHVRRMGLGVVDPDPTGATADMGPKAAGRDHVPRTLLLVGAPALHTRQVGNSPVRHARHAFDTTVSLGPANGEVAVVGVAETPRLGRRRTRRAAGRPSPHPPDAEVTGLAVPREDAVTPLLGSDRPAVVATPQVAVEDDPVGLLATLPPTKDTVQPQGTARDTRPPREADGTGRLSHTAFRRPALAGAGGAAGRGPPVAPGPATPVPGAAAVRPIPRQTRLVVILFAYKSKPIHYKLAILGRPSLFLRDMVRFAMSRNNKTFY